MQSQCDAKFDRIKLHSEQKNLALYCNIKDSEVFFSRKGAMNFCIWKYIMKVFEKTIVCQGLMQKLLHRTTPCVISDF